MEHMLRIAATLALAVTVPILFRARPAIRQTTLAGAWVWTTISLGVWGSVWSITQTSRAVPPGLADQLWYATAVVAVCPPIAVLGARRPGTGVWTCFILLPLLVVLGWPAWAVWGSGFPLPRLELAAPAVLGYGVVLVMGAGNYFGTRYWASAGLYAASLLCIVLPFLQSVSARFPNSQIARGWGTLLFAAAIVTAAISSRRAARVASSSGLDRVWILFRDSFGMVWARRTQDQLNDVARQEGWPARLDVGGIVWTDPQIAEADRTKTGTRIEQTFRRLLKRFVDPEWIDERLAEVPEVQ